MKIHIVRLFTALLALIGFAVGAKGMFLGLAELHAPPMIDNEYRFFAGIWFGVGCGFAYCLFHIRNCAAVYRGLMATVFIGGIARAIGALAYPSVDPQIIVAIIIELILPVILVRLQADLEENAAP